MLILLDGSTGACRPTPACGDFLVDCAVYSVSGRSLNSSRKSEFGDSGHRRTPTGDLSKIAADRLLSKMRQCANDPLQPYTLAQEQPFESHTKAGSQHLRRALRQGRTRLAFG